jgi:hypothetical protein
MLALALDESMKVFLGILARCDRLVIYVLAHGRGNDEFEAGV